MIIFACSPAARLTPIASYITTAANANAIANSDDDTPHSLAVDIANATTKAECELGIPPEPTSLSNLIFFVNAAFISVLSTCAENQETNVTCII